MNSTTAFLEEWTKTCKAMSEGEVPETGVGLLAPGGVSAFLKKLTGARHIETSQAASRQGTLRTLHSSLTLQTPTPFPRRATDRALLHEFRSRSRDAPLPFATPPAPHPSTSPQVPANVSSTHGTPIPLPMCLTSHSRTYLDPSQLRTVIPPPQAAPAPRIPTTRTLPAPRPMPIPGLPRPTRVHVCYTCGWPTSTRAHKRQTKKGESMQCNETNINPQVFEIRRNNASNYKRRCKQLGIRPDFGENAV